MNMSQVDLNTKSKDMQNFNMMFENGGVPNQRYQLFKDNANSTFNQMMDGTPTPANTKQKNTIFPGDTTTSKLPQGEEDDSKRTGGQSVGKNQVDFTMMTSIRQFQMQSNNAGGLQAISNGQMTRINNIVGQNANSVHSKAPENGGISS